MGLSAGAIALMAAGTAAGTATSAIAAREQNRALSRSAGVARDNAEAQQMAINEAAAVQSDQLRDQASVDRIQRERETQILMGRVRAAAGAAGVDITSGSYEALARQTQLDMAFNQSIANQNLRNALRSVESQRAAGLISSDSSLNATLAGLN